MIHEDVYLIMSNLTIFVSVYFCYKEKRWIPCVFLFFAGITSFIYHTLWAIPVNENFQLVRYYFTFLDFYHETLALISVCVSMVPISKYNQFLLFLLYYFMYIFLCMFVSFFVPIDGNFVLFGIDVQSKVAIIVLLFSFLAIYIVSYYIYMLLTDKKILISYYPLYTSLITSAVSVICFYVAYFVYYWIFHSLWHIGIMLTTYFVLKIKEVEQEVELLDMRVPRGHQRTISNLF